MTDQSGLLAEYHEHLLGVFGDPSLVLTHGRGCEVWDADGNRYLDLLGGIAVNALGHAHPAWVDAVSEQAARLAHVSNFFTTPQHLALAAAVLELTGAPEGSHVFFANSGSEANEAAFKLARRHGTEHPSDSGAPRTRVLALEHAFHGRTMGSLALTAKPAYRQPFEPLPGGVQHIPATEAALAEHVDDTVAALFVEPVQGEAGVRSLPEGFLAAARRITREHGALLIVDEVQSGMGRTGAWLASSAQLPPDDAPDVITLAKGLGGGFPVGALITVGHRVSSLLGAGQHGTTFGGNPLAMAAGLATITTIRSEGLLEHAQRLGHHAEAVFGACPDVEAVRAHGLLIGIDLLGAHDDHPLAPAVVTAARAAGFIVNATGPATVRLAPPLIVTAEQLDDFATALPSIVAAARANLAARG